MIEEERALVGPFLSRREVFESVKNHLLTQNARAIIKHLEVCGYRTAEGLKCAAGHLIKDEHYTPIFEGFGVDHPLVSDALVKSGVAAHDHGMVAWLQSCHDHHEPGTWPERLDIIARKFGLD